MLYVCGEGGVSESALSSGRASQPTAERDGRGTTEAAAWASLRPACPRHGANVTCSAVSCRHGSGEPCSTTASTRTADTTYAQECSLPRLGRSSTRGSELGYASPGRCFICGRVVRRTDTVVPQIGTDRRHLVGRARGDTASTQNESFIRPSEEEEEVRHLCQPVRSQGSSRSFPFLGEPATCISANMRSVAHAAEN